MDPGFGVGTLAILGDLEKPVRAIQIITRAVVQQFDQLRDSVVLADHLNLIHHNAVADCGRQGATAVGRALPLTFGEVFALQGLLRHLDTVHLNLRHCLSLSGLEGFPSLFLYLVYHRFTGLSTLF